MEILAAEHALAQEPRARRRQTSSTAVADEDRWPLWHQPLSTWSWTLTERPPGQTRLVTRLRIHLDWHHPVVSPLSVVLNEFGDFPMMRRMPLGIRDRAETR